MFKIVLLALFACGGMSTYDNIGGNRVNPDQPDTDPPDTDGSSDTDPSANDTALPPGSPDTALPPPITGPNDSDGGSDPNAAIALADIVGTYQSGNRAIQSVYQALGQSDQCTGFVQVTVSGTGQITGTGACSWPLFPPPLVALAFGGFDETMMIEINAQVRQNDHTIIAANQSTIRIYDTGSTDTISLNGRFVRNSNGQVELELQHNGRLVGIGFASNGYRTYRK